MNTFKKRDVKNRLSVSRDTNPDSAVQVCQPGGTGTPKIEPGPVRARALPFVDDFNFEHSFTDVSITQIAISASADFAAPAKHRNHRTYDLDSPNCAYIG